MIEVRGKRVLVVGLGTSGHAAALCLRRHGAQVIVTDTKPPAAVAPFIPELLAEKIGLELGSQRLETFLAHDLVVVSPGVPWDLSQLKVARERGIPVVPEIEVASWYLSGPIVGITGSNGKTTTTALLGKMLEASGLPVFIGGNIGVPLSSAVDRINPGSIIVAELSSFQLEAIQDFRPHVAVLLNISPNHLDRHPSLEAYAEAKRQIFRNQQAEDYAILNADDPWVCGLSPALVSQKVFFSRSRPIPCGLFVSNRSIVYRIRHLERVLLETRDVHLRGDFNLENVLAAAAAACVLGADFDAMRTAVREFQGVEHRLEHVCDIRGVAFYNNSKATSVEATVKSLEAFERGVHLILGGKDKGAPYAPLLPLLKDRVKDVFLIGAAAERIAQELAGATELIRSGTLEAAAAEAFERARPGDVVLLAPACSSFDQFQNYEQRGRVFKDLVRRLAQDQTTESKPAERGGKPKRQVETGASVKQASAGTPPPSPLERGLSKPKTDASTRRGSAAPLVEESAALRPVPGPLSVPAEAGKPSLPDGAEEILPDVRPTEKQSLSPTAAEPQVPVRRESLAAPLVKDSSAEIRPDAPTLVYETNWEELPPGDIELDQDYPDELELRELQTPPTLERTEGEFLPYESRSGKKEDLKQSEPGSKPQPRLPGMD
jgi:UDP-N-acetylmuramoylalanine--D-glutamate ligase